MSVYAAFSYINDSKSLDLRVLDAELLDLNKNSWKGMLGQEKKITPDVSLYLMVPVLGIEYLEHFG